MLNKSGRWLLAILLFGCIASISSAAERPNLLWISCEDISPDLRCYGDSYAISPNIDRLASEGVRFSRAFSHSGVCAPTRSGIITGMYPISIGTHHMRCKGVPPAEVSCFSQYLRAAGYYCTNDVKTDYQFASPLTAWDENKKGAHWRGREEGQPFFAVINLTITHESQIRDPKELTQKLVSQLNAEERHDPTKASLPPYYPDTPLVRRDWANYHDNITAMDKQVAEILKQLDEDGLAEDTIVWFWGDHGRGLPRGKRWIYDSGLQFPLIVRVPQKWRESALPGHAEDLAPGTVNDDLVAFIDFAPTMLSLAGVKIPDHIQGRAFLGSQKAAPREYIFAHRDRMDERYDLIRAVRDKRFKYIRNFMRYVPYSQDIWYMNKMPTMQEMRRLHAANQLFGPQKLYFRQIKPLEELYDTQADPHELDNLADDPRFAEKLTELRAALKDWRVKTGDVGLIPEAEFDEMKRPGGVFSVTAQPKVVSKRIKTTGVYQVTLSSPTPGAGIVYLRGGPDLKIPENPGQARWKLYTGPFAVVTGEKVCAMACRLGYKDSKPLMFHTPLSPSTNFAPESEVSQPHWRQQLNESNLLAELAALRELDADGEKAVPRYLAALESEHASVRYWAVVGLHRNLDANEQIQREVTRHLDDSAPVVRIAVARAMCDWGQAERGLPVLGKLLAHQQNAVRLQAALALDEIGETARPLVPEIRKSLDDSFGYVVRVSENILAKFEPN